MNGVGIPPSPRGLTVFLTGLSGSGKSTIARALEERLTHTTGRPVTILDGDLVRRHLTSELGFSREHRDLNVRRVGFVAAEIARHGGTVVCALIAPYETAREEVRRMVAPHGDFLLVYLDTPMAICEARDPKGLYRAARAGRMEAFTGVSDPYETPTAPDLTIDTSVVPVGEAVTLIVEAMARVRQPSGADTP
jgi:sulfate adenylyltransferase